MVTFTVTIPAPAALVGYHLDEAALRTPERDYTGIAASAEAARVLHELSRAAHLGTFPQALVTIKTTRAALGPLARACRQHAAETYPDNPAIPVLLDIATAAIMAVAEAA